jgi:thioredoxin 1
MTNVQRVNDQTFQDQVLDAGGLVLMDFYADSCAPCKAQAPVLESFAANQTEAVKVVKLNVDEAPSAAQLYGIRSIPTLALFANGEVQRQNSAHSSKTTRTNLNLTNL